MILDIIFITYIIIYHYHYSFIIFIYLSLFSPFTHIILIDYMRERGEIVAFSLVC